MSDAADVPVRTARAAGDPGAGPRRPGGHDGVGRSAGDRLLDRAATAAGRRSGHDHLRVARARSRSRRSSDGPPGVGAGSRSRSPSPAAAGRPAFARRCRRAGCSRDERRPRGSRTVAESSTGVRASCAAWIIDAAYRDRPIGVLPEQRGRRLTAVLACRVVAFSLLDHEAQERRLARWGLVLSGAGGGPIRRLQWIERTAPAQGDELARWVHAERDPSIPPRGTAMIESYLELIDTTHQGRAGARGPAGGPGRRAARPRARRRRGTGRSWSSRPSGSRRAWRRPR